MHAIANLVDMILIRQKGAPKKIAPVKMPEALVSDKCAECVIRESRDFGYVRLRRMFVSLQFRT